MEIKNFTITKRDGSKDCFSLDKIMNAIIKAFNSVDEPADLGCISKIIAHLDIHENITVEDIQNQVEEALMKEGYYKVSKSFMLYRQRHTEDRETMEKLKFLSEYCQASNAATGSKYDANANVEHKNIATLCTIMGAVFLFAGVTDAVDIIGAWQILPDPGELFSDLVMAIGGGGALLTGLRMNRTRKLERLLDKVVGERDNIPLPELFAAAGVDAARGRAAVKSAIEHGYFGADAYIDNRTDTLVVRGAAPQPKKPAPAPAPKAQPAAEDEYAALLRQLREVNDAIPDPVMSQKISRLEEVSGRIFALAQKDPEKKAQLQKFMNYYLPTALKLLNTYASLSGQAVEGTNITDAKHSIERSMDLLVTAFENQLDKLFQADALDVNADIAALEGMLNLDGLTGSEFTR